MHVVFAWVCRHRELRLYSVALFLVPALWSFPLLSHRNNPQITGQLTTVGTAAVMMNSFKGVWKYGNKCGNFRGQPHSRVAICYRNTGYRRSWNCCDRRTCFVVIWTHFCFILSTGTVMHPRSSSRGRNTSASVTVTVTGVRLNTFDYI